MRARFPHTKWYGVAAVVVLTMALIACSPFGRGQDPTPAPTNTPPPTETPLPVLPTFTATAVPTEPAQAATAAPSDEAKPTFTPTPPSVVKPPEKPAEKPSVGGEQPVVAAPVTIVVTKAPTVGDVIENGNFEDGFGEQGVAVGWSSFDNAEAVYAWVDELDPMHVSHDEHAQLMRIMGPGEPNRYVGIYQTVDVVPGETYTLTLHGLLRSSTAEDASTPYGHRMQYAIDYEGKGNWQQIIEDWDAWTDPGWNDIKLDDDEPQMNAYVQQIEAENDQLTVYVRGWTKWPILGSEAKFYIDGVTLRGPVPGEETVITVSSVKESAGGKGMPTTGGNGIWLPVAGAILILGFVGWEVRKLFTR
jgi:hypothetical protein